MEITLKANQVYSDLQEALKSNPRVILLEGGSRSGKTHALLTHYFLTSLNEPGRLSVWRAKRTWTKASVWFDWVNFLKNHNLYNEKAENRSDLVYKNGKGEIHFGGLDDYQKLHGYQGVDSWLNEGMEASKEDFDQLAMRTERHIFIDYNPTEEEHWVYELMKRPDTVLLHSTQIGNAFLPEAIRQQIRGYEPTPENIAKGTADDYKWKVYALGIRAKKEGLVFPKGFNLVPDWTANVRQLGYGLDFGYNPDPTACVRVGLLNGKLILDEVFYENDLTNVSFNTGNSIEERLRTNNITSEIIADSASPTSIAELQGKRFNVIGVRKYAGSVGEGLRVMSNYAPFYVTERSVNLIKELKNYTYKKDYRTGIYTNDPMDNFNHGIDAARYVVLSKIAPHGGGKTKLMC